MQKIQCSLCGSVDIIRIEDDIFQCQFCGCKYTLEQARNLIVTGEVKTKAVDFEIVGGVLKKYNGEDTDVVVPDQVRKIGTGAFKGLTINSVHLPEGLIEIEEGAFAGCSYLESIDFPNSLHTISGFDNCSSLKSVIIPDGVTAIGARAFCRCGSLVSVDFPNSVSYIGPAAFAGCTQLKSIVLNGVVNIGANAFQGCSSLKSISFSSNLRTVGNRAFDHCTSFTDIDFPVGLEKIDDYAFSNCFSLTDINLPTGLKSIGHFVFENCSSLNDIYVPDGCDVNEAGLLMGNKFHVSSENFRKRWIRDKKCLHCGGEFKGLFTKYCSKCGKPKDY